MSDATPGDATPPEPPVPPTPPASGAAPAAPAAPQYAQPYPAPAPQSPYGQQPYPQPVGPGAYPPPVYPAPYGPRTNGLAIVSLVSALIGLFVVPFIGSVVAVITGHISLHQLKTNGETGRGMALAGVIIGWISIGLTVTVLVVWFFVVLASTGAYTYRDYYSS